MRCYRADGEGIILSVRLTPKGGRDAIDGIITLASGEDVVAARVRAAPDKGAANAALVTLLAKALGRPKTAVSLVSGTTARLKRVRITGDPLALGRTVDGWPRR
jgi:uncharacterized protein (TIGR00251 family)